MLALPQSRRVPDGEKSVNNQATTPVQGTGRPISSISHRTIFLCRSSCEHRTWGATVDAMVNASNKCVQARDWTTCIATRARLFRVLNTTTRLFASTVRGLKWTSFFRYRTRCYRCHQRHSTHETCMNLLRCLTPWWTSKIGVVFVQPRIDRALFDIAGVLRR